MADWQDVILVNQAGRRFYDETAGQFTGNRYDAIKPYTPGSYLNAANIKYDPANFLNAALAGTGEAVNGGPLGDGEDVLSFEFAVGVIAEGLLDSGDGHLVLDGDVHLVVEHRQRRQRFLFGDEQPGSPDRRKAGELR